MEMGLLAKNSETREQIKILHKLKSIYIEG